MKRSEEFYEGDRESILSTAGRGETMQEVLARRWSRRDMVKGCLATGMVLTLGTPAILATSQVATPGATGTPVATAPAPAAAAAGSALGFAPIVLDEGEEMVVDPQQLCRGTTPWGTVLTGEENFQR